MSKQDIHIRLFEYGYDQDDMEAINHDIAQYVIDCCRMDRVAELDELLYEIDTDCVPTTSLVFLLQYTSFIAFEHLSHWNDLAERARQSSIRRGEDPDTWFGDVMSADQSNRNTSLYTLKLLGLDIPGR